MRRKNRKKKYQAALCIAVFLLLAVTGCGGSKMNSMSGESSTAVQETRDMAMPAEVAEAAAEEMDGGGITSENGIDPVAQNGRKLIRTVRLEMQTKEFDTLVEGITKKVQEMDGYIENSSIWGNSYYNDNTRSAEYTARVPSDRLSEFIEVVGGLGNIIYKNEGIEDVTLQYVDVESRKKSLETEQDRLLELLEKAENLEDLLAIESRLSEVRYELENYGSQKRLLDNQIDYSTVYLSIVEVERITETGEKSFFQEIAERFSDSLYRVGNGLREFVIVLFGSLPVLAVWTAVIAVIVLVVRRFFYRKKVLIGFKNKKTNQNETQEKTDQQ